VRNGAARRCKVLGRGFVKMPRMRGLKA